MYLTSGPKLSCDAFRTGMGRPAAHSVEGLSPARLSGHRWWSGLVLKSTGMWAAVALKAQVRVVLGRLFPLWTPLSTPFTSVAHVNIHHNAVVTNAPMLAALPRWGGWVMG